MKTTLLALALIAATGAVSAQTVASVAPVKNPELIQPAVATPHSTPPSSGDVSPPSAGSGIVSPPTAGSSKITAPT